MQRSPLPAYAFVVLAMTALPRLAGAQDLRPPAGDPHAFTPAPIPALDGGRVDPADRAGGAFDAGPINASPFSGVLSTGVSGTEVARALSQSRPNHDPLAATLSPE